MQGHETNRTKMDDRDYSVECVQCGKMFEAKRSDASFCCAKCRVAYSREPQKLENAIADLEAMMVRVRQMSNKYSRNKRVFEKVKELSTTVNYSLGNFYEE